jgi:hypothetical protein
MNEVFGLNREAWSRWVEYRKQRRKPYKTDFGRSRAMKKLASFGDYQMEAVERCMEKEWVDLYPLPKADLLALEKKKRDDGKRLRTLADLAVRAAEVGFRQPFAGEDEVGYRTLVERAEHMHWQKRKSAPRSIGELLGAKS